MADLPIGSIVMFDGATPPAGWYDCDGSTHGGIQTPNLIGKFPRGVPSGGSLGATGGSTTHIHANPDTAYQTHGHPETSLASNNRVGTVSNVWAGSNYAIDEHTHLVTIAAVINQVNHKHTMPNTGDASSLPPNISLRFIMRCE